MSLELNILAHSVNHWDALYAHTNRYTPRAALVMDEPLRAESLARLYPSATVVHRAWFAGDNDAHYHITPETFLDAFGNVGRSGRIYVQALNEAPVDTVEHARALCDWLERLMTLAHQQGIRLAVAGISVGNPPPPLRLIENGHFDKLLLALYRFPEMALLLHEYFINDGTSEPNRVGLFRTWLARADKLGIQRPHILTGEFGRDVAGGNDGYKAAGWSGKQYAEKCIAAYQAVYKPFDIHPMVFCYGRGANDRWITFDVQSDNGYLDTIAAFNAQEDNSMEWDYGDAVKDATAKTPGAVNIRTQADTSSAVIGTLSNNDVVTFWENRSPSQNDGHYWWRIQKGETAGFVADTYVDFTDPPITPPTPPDDALYIPFNATEIQQLATLHTQIANIYRNALTRA